MYEKRLKTIKAVCEKIKNQPHKPKLRVKNKRQASTSHTVKTRRIPKWCIDRVPSDAQIVGETELHYLVKH